jgi:hypothetical protein
MGDPASDATGAYKPGSYIGLTADVVAPVVGDLALAGEITVGTLARSLATYAHLDGTNVYTLTKSFTSDQVVTINKTGVFNAPTGGTLCFEGLVPVPPNMQSGDSIQITATITI